MRVLPLALGNSHGLPPGDAAAKHEPADSMMAVQGEARRVESITLLRAIKAAALSCPEGLIATSTEKG